MAAATARNLAPSTWRGQVGPKRKGLQTMRNRSGLPKHCSWNVDRENGKRRIRFRKAGFTTYLTGLPYSDDFNAQYWAALEGVKKNSDNIGAELRTKPGSL